MQSWRRWRSTAVRPSVTALRPSVTVVRPRYSSVRASLVGADRYDSRIPLLPVTGQQSRVPRFTASDPDPCISQSRSSSSSEASYSQNSQSSATCKKWQWWLSMPALPACPLMPALRVETFSATPGSRFWLSSGHQARFLLFTP